MVHGRASLEIRKVGLRIELKVQKIIVQPWRRLPRNLALNQWFLAAYSKEFNAVPNFPAYHMFNSLLGLKAAWEKAAAAKGMARPTTDEVATAFTGLTFETAGGPVQMARGNGHQGIEDVAIGIYVYNKTTGKPELHDLVTYPAECVNPPIGMTSEEWLKQGMPGAKC